jgi:hypothetical protein
MLELTSGGSDAAVFLGVWNDDVIVILLPPPLLDDCFGVAVILPSELGDDESFVDCGTGVCVEPFLFLEELLLREGQDDDDMILW